MEKNEITFEGVDKPHDRIIKWSFGRTVVAAPFFESYSPEAVSVGIEWDQLSSYPGTFVDEELVESHTDLLFKAPIRGLKTPVYFYFLFEHLTNPDRSAVLRLGQYKLDIWNKLRGENTKGKTFELPYILTFVVHQGDEWNPPTRISGLMKRPNKAPEDLLDSLQELELDMGYIPVTVPRYQPENLKGHILGRVTLALMNAAIENRCVEFLNDHADMIDELLREDESLGMLKTLLRYTFQVDNESWNQYDKVVKQIKSQIVKEQVMTFTEQLRKEGRKEGRKKERVDLICQLLEDSLGKLPEATRKKVKKLSPDLLFQLLKTAHSIENAAELDDWLAEHDSK